MNPKTFYFRKIEFCLSVTVLTKTIICFYPLYQHIIIIDHYTLLIGSDLLFSKKMNSRNSLSL